MMAPEAVRPVPSDKTVSVLTERVT